MVVALGREHSMNTIKIHLEHCYGIKFLDETLDFSKHSSIAIYAPNGMMKSSFARTLDDVSKGQKPRDLIYTDEETECEVRDEKNSPLSPDSILVFGPYDRALDPAKRVSNLLLSRKLKETYDELTGGILNAKDALLSAIKSQARTKLSLSELETELSVAMNRVKNEFEKSLARLRREVEKQDVTPYSELDYDLIFNQKVTEFLKTDSARDNITSYVIRYNELLDASQFFSRSTLNYYGAEQVAKSLNEHGFFKAKHVVRLKSRNGESREVTNEEELTKIIAEEKAEILKDPKLSKEFSSFAKKCERNVELRRFVDYLQQNPTWLAELQDTEKFKSEIWKSYLKTHSHLFFDFLDKFESAEEKLAELRAAALTEKTRWEYVLGVFNDRFYVPFTVTAKNKADACLGSQSHVDYELNFTDGPKPVEVKREHLLDVLSTGQKKAYYILNILFDLYSRREAGKETLVVFDDIADSFDYQNKYAIIQYLQDLTEDSAIFKQIIMTHNFDFYRTLVWRNVVDRENCLMANKEKDGKIKLEAAEGIRDAFKNMFKKDFSTDTKCAIACIPFLRNMRELQVADEHSDYTYLKLTALLHWKQGETDAICRKDLDDAYKQIFPHDAITAQNGHERMTDLIFRHADDCLTEKEGVNFHNKLILSIAIRLVADRHMVNKIADEAFLKTITGRQTNRLFNKFKDSFPRDPSLGVLSKVILMTPENIHLNSFMYEPIIDMSDAHLRDLYKQVRDLK
jgi:energy-coupling factor transporter ATP-binding protein EcfA2